MDRTAGVSVNDNSMLEGVRAGKKQAAQEYTQCSLQTS